MKKMSQSLDNNMLYFATDRVMFHVREPYRIQEEMIEMKNFVPEAFMIHQFQEYRDLEMECYDCIRVSKTGERSGPVSHPVQVDGFKLGDEDGDDDNWDDEDDDWDDEDDEDWDEDDEDDWDDEDDEDWDDEDDDDFDDDAEDDAEE